MGSRLLVAATFVTTVATVWSGCGTSAARAPRRAAPSASRRGTVRREDFFSPALGRRRSYLVYLPPGYAAAARSGRRFPVLYLLHSAVGRPSRFLAAGHVDRALADALAARAVRPMLLVMPDGRGQGGTDSEWANTGLGRYEDALVDVVRAVDRRWATRPDRRARILAGASTGGFAAANVALHRLPLFGGFESWSGYFRETPTDAFAGASPALLAANSPVDYTGRLAARLRRLPLAGTAYEGSREPDPTELDLFCARFRRAGGRISCRHLTGRHGWILWRAQMPAMLRWASREFGAGP